MRVYLIGFMGTGKTYWGRIWSAETGIPLLDLDEEIERRSGIRVRQWFEERGEEAFRAFEAEVLRDLAGRENLLLACGGGTPCFHDNMEWMNAHGLTIYLQSSVEELVARLQPEKEHRPLLADVDDQDLAGLISKKLAVRTTFYEQAKIYLLTKELTPQTLKEILNRYA